MDKLMDKRKGALLGALVLGIVAVMFLTSAALRKDVVIYDGDTKYLVSTTSSKMTFAFKKCGIELKEKDEVHPEMSTSLSDGMEIHINRAKAYLVDVDQDVKEVYSTGTTVGAILEEHGYALGTYDRVEPPVDTEVHGGGRIAITRVDVEDITEEVGMPMQTVIKLVDSLEEGQTRQISEGNDGLARVTFRVTYEDGHEISREILDEEILEEPMARVIEKGMDNLYVTNRGKPFRYSQVIIMQATAYDLSYESCGKYPDHPEYGITRSGTRAKPGVVAVDPRVIPLGSKLYVESLDRTLDYGFASAEDTGGAIKGNRIDLFIGDRKSALRYGRRYVRVYVLDDRVDPELIQGYNK